MKREQAFQEILKIQRVCRGRWVLPEEIRRGLSEKLGLISLTTYELDIKEFQEIRKKFGLSEIRIDSLIHLLNEYLQLINLCWSDIGKPCRYDVNQEILKYPFDGSEHNFNCPKCGTEIQFTSPIFNITE